MNATTLLQCLSALLREQQIKGIVALTQTIDLDLRDILTDTINTHGHIQFAIDQYLFKHKSNAPLPATTAQIESIRSLCFID